MGGGILTLSIFLALSLAFASCANNSDSDDCGNPSPALPDNVGENPITKTIRLYSDSDKERYLEIGTDGTALYICEDKYEEVQTKYKYTYDTDAKKIYMKVEKQIYGGEFFSETESQLLTYDETLSKFNEDLTVEKQRQGLRENYEESKDDKWFKEDYPECDTYEKYEAAVIKNIGFKTFDDYVKYLKQFHENAFKRIFGAQITYAYKIENGKLTLTEKFTGIKNMFNSECKFNDGSSYGDISCNWAYINIEDDDRYSGSVDADKKTIEFESKKGEKIYATYTEEINRERVIIKFKDKEYVCQFEGEKYTQVE